MAAPSRAPPPGKLAGPFRWLNIWYQGPERLQSLTLQFQRAADERLFTQAVANGLKARSPTPEAAQPKAGEAHLQPASAAG